MAGVRGIQHKNRAVHPSGKPVRATVILHPGDEERPLYEELVKDMNVSGAEVLREAIRELYKRESRRKARKTAKEAAENANTEAQELPKAG
ncbi:hypothetical protein ABZT45_34660 [Streptomyces sp. NPDC005356]|uniref:hypothetical protein n=1 Tax=Streptomyces sp. NPDC005356 TaxID=3157167 RepID=UPI0033B2D6DD